MDVFSCSSSRERISAMQVCTNSSVELWTSFFCPAVPQHVCVAVSMARTAEEWRETVKPLLNGINR